MRRLWQGMLEIQQRLDALLVKCLGSIDEPQNCLLKRGKVERGLEARGIGSLANAARSMYPITLVVRPYSEKAKARAPCRGGWTEMLTLGDSRTARVRSE
jgi:hypothetical protein